jgi:hypothetical protein
MRVPSPCVSPRVGDPAFAYMKRVVRLGARLFPLKIISCCLLEEGVPPLICSIAFFHVGTDYVGFQHRRLMKGSADMDGITRELRFDN